MLPIRRLVFFMILMAATTTVARAAVIANSIAEFSLVQGQNNWNYGIFDNTALGAYNPNAFFQFDDNTTPGTWRATAGLVNTSGGPANNSFLNLNALGGHPAGTGIDGIDRNLWAVRRYTSEVSGLVQIDFNLKKINVGNPDGTGITGRIFLDGTQVYQQFIRNIDDLGVQSSLVLNVNLNSRIDFAIDSLGETVVNGRDQDPRSPRADGSHFSAVISTVTAVPEPSSLTIVSIAAGLICFHRRKSMQTGVV